jgi:hypothetical protein
LPAGDMLTMGLQFHPRCFTPRPAECVCWTLHFGHRRPRCVSVPSIARSKSAAEFCNAFPRSADIYAADRLAVLEHLVIEVVTVDRVAKGRWDGALALQ